MELVAASWERIQCTLALRPVGGGDVDPGAFSLTPLSARDAAGPREIVAPAAATMDDGRVVLRFNVMQGPGQLPLTPGHWQLVGAPRQTEGVPTRVAVRDARPAGGRLPAAHFLLAEGRLSFVPSIDRSGSLRIRVDLDRSIRRRSRRSPVKRVLVTAKRLLRPLRRRLFRILFRFARATRVPGRPVILFASIANHELAGNLRLVHDRMVERGVHRDHRLRTMFRPPPGRRRTLRDRFRLPLRLGRADIVVLDDYYPLIYETAFGPHVKVVQLWHASGAFKTVGYSRVGRPGAPSPYGRAHKNYTHAIVSSRHEVPHYAEAFGLPEWRIHPTGIPRMDRFFDEGSRRDGRARTHELFPGSRGRMTILFAPTFRGSGARAAHYDMAWMDFGALHALCLEKDACVIFRMHPFVRRPVPIPADLSDRLFDASIATIDVNDLLPAADLLITDYSSTVFEFAALGRPMLFFAYDLDDYVSGRGFYTPYRRFVPGRIVETFPELLDAIRRDDYQVEKVTPFAAQHLDHLDGGSTDRVIDLILDG